MTTISTTVCPLCAGQLYWNFCSNGDMTYYGDSKHRFMCWNKVPDTKTPHYTIEMYPVQQIINTKRYSILVNNDGGRSLAYRFADRDQYGKFYRATQIYIPKFPMPLNPSKTIDLMVIDNFVRSYDPQFKLDRCL